jgi:hypothetical protein
MAELNKVRERIIALSPKAKNTTIYNEKYFPG